MGRPSDQEMLSRITDTAHTLARWHTDSHTPDLDAARRAVLHALDIEETSEVLYRDLLHIEWAAGIRQRSAEPSPVSS
ncbi:hypothetical protein [Streptomyces erythrochromogenes]|uniref:hypothetical protein n=1 Tax=Streptomyces erythrochromogenes TaxID=285574 RepID=UPI003686CD70